MTLRLLQRFLKNSLLIGILVTVSGCAFSRTSTQVTFAPTVHQPLADSAKDSVMVGPIKDSRPVEDPAVLIHKSNAYGRTTGAYVAQKPVADIFRDGFISSLKQNQFAVLPDSAKYEIRADIQDFSFETIAGFWTAKVKPKLQVRFELLERRTGEALWRDTYTGRGNVETAWGTAETVVQLFNLGADDVLRQLLADSSFRRYFEPKQ